MSALHSSNVIQVRYCTSVLRCDCCPKCYILWMNIVYALLKNDKYSIKIVSRMHIFSFHYLLRVHKSKSKTGVEFADSYKWNWGNFSFFSISELANWVKLKTIELFLHQQEQKSYRAEQDKKQNTLGPLRAYK